MAAVLAAMLFAGARARAQTASGTMDHARALFQQGVAAADAGRWEEAHQLFEQTYAVLPRPVVLLNLAGARAQTGRLVSAVDAYRTVADDASGANRELRDAAREALVTLERRIPRVRLSFGETLLERDEVRLDEVALDTAARELERPLDPGRHAVAVLRSGIEVLREDFRLYEGERLHLDLRVPPEEAVASEPIVAESIAPAPSSPGHDESSWWRSPVFWTVVGVVVAGAVGVGIAVSLGTEEPYVGNLHPGAITVR